MPPRTGRPPIRSVGRVIVVDVGIQAPRLSKQLDATGVPVTYLPAAGSATYDAILAALDDDTDSGMAILASDADVSGPALDDVVLDPRPTTRLLVDLEAHPSPGEPLGAASMTSSGWVTLAGRRVTSATTARHAGTAVDGRSLGVLAVAAQDHGQARTAILAAQSFADAASGEPVDPVDLLVTALVRHSVAVTAVPVQPLVGRRLGYPDAVPASEPDAGSAESSRDDDPSQLSEQDETDRRWRAASRADDGFFSTFAVRPVSRRLSRALGEHGWSPNQVTTVSALVGVAAAIGFATGSPLGLILGAIALQASLVLDCSDGEIARFTRSYTTAGAWLDAATDRIKEYLALAGLAVGAARTGDDIWLLAAAAMAVQTVRHMQDFAFVHTVLAQWRSPVIDRRCLSATTPNFDVTRGGTAVGEAVLDVSAGSARRVVFWVKRIVHLPIAERWLLLSIGALIGSPWLSIVLYLGADVVAWAWTTIGWWRRSLRSPTGVSRAAAAVLRRYRDDGPLGELIRARGARRTPERGEPSTVEETPHHAFAWMGPPLVTALEFAAVIVSALVVIRTDGMGESAIAGAWAFGWIAAVAWHRYDVVYRWRDWRESPDGWVTVAMLGWPLRLVVVIAAVTATTTSHTPGIFITVLVVGTVWFALVDVVALVPVVGRLIPDTDTPDSLKAGGDVASP